MEMVKKKWPKTPPTIPTAKRNHRGKIISCPTGIKKILSKEYKHRLRARPVRPDLESMKVRKNLIFRMKMKWLTLWKVRCGRWKIWIEHYLVYRITNQEMLMDLWTSYLRKMLLVIIWRALSLTCSSSWKRIKWFQNGRDFIHLQRV